MTETTIPEALSAALAVAPEIDVDLTPRHPIGPALPFWVIRWAGEAFGFRARPGAVLDHDVGGVTGAGPSGLGVGFLQLLRKGDGALDAVKQILQSLPFGCL